jgi:DNA-binding beta-propeller fold protein YncE
MFKILNKIITIIFIVLLCMYSCTERDRGNPLDPKSKVKPDVNLSILSYNDRIELKWWPTNFTNYKGYNLYRQNHPDSSFILIADEILPDPTVFIDTDITYKTTYSYYLTIQGGEYESSPSNIVSITPGPGYNWIVDNWGYQVIKSTYDAKYKIDEYYTDWRPQDIAIDSENNIALITQPTGGRIDIINTQTARRDTFFTSGNRFFIDHPYLTEFDPKNKMFWISDSAGTIYRISSIDYSINLIQSDIIKPDEIFIDHVNETVYIIDDKSNYIYLYDLNGNYINKISQIADYTFKKPKKFVLDSSDNQFWLVEELSNKDYLYTGFIANAQISLVDSFDYVFELSLSPVDHTLWIAVFENANSTIMQLSKAGVRQLEQNGYYNPYHVTHNPYDGTLLVTDTGNRRVMHYDEDFEILGIFTNLNFPVRVQVE